MIKSDFALPDLDPLDDGSIASTINVSADSNSTPGSIAGWQWQKSVRLMPMAEPWHLLEKSSRYMLRYGDLLHFSIGPDPTDIVYCAPDWVSDRFLESSLLTLVIPFALHLMNLPVFHAGAAEVESEALVFIGHSGQGKSTLSAAFARAGYPMITDDVLPIGQTNGRMLAIPSLPWIRLWRESFEALFGGDRVADVFEDDDGKLRVDVGAGLLPFAKEPCPLRAIYVLDDRENLPDGQLIKTSLIPPAEAVGIIMGRTSMLPLLNQEQVAGVFKSLGELVKTVPVWRLTLVRGLDHLPDAVDGIVRHAKKYGVSSFISS